MGRDGIVFLVGLDRRIDVQIEEGVWEMIQRPLGYLTRELRGILRREKMTLREWHYMG